RHMVDDRLDRAVPREDGRVQRLPVTLFKTASFGSRARYVILLDAHAVRRLRLKDAPQGRTEVLHAVGFQIFWIVWEGLEDAEPDEFLPVGFRRTQIGVVHAHNGEDGIVGGNKNIRGGRSLEDSFEPGRRTGPLRLRLFQRAAERHWMFPGTLTFTDN